MMIKRLKSILALPVCTICLILNLPQIFLAETSLNIPRNLLAATVKQFNSYGIYGGDYAQAGFFPPRPETAIPFDYSLYGSWNDAGRDCQNADISIDLINSNTDCIITHMVPLAWAHAHGADQWTVAMRRKFANDPANLLAVQVSVNQSRKNNGPLHWMPSNVQCSYIAQFDKIVQTYKLTYSDSERRGMNTLRARLCI